MSVKCFIRTKQGGTKKARYKKGQTVKFKGVEGEYGAPMYDNHEILRIEGPIITRQWAFYQEGIVKAIPIDSTYEMQEWGPADKENLHGDFLASLIRRALQDESKMKMVAYITLSAAILGACAAIMGAWWIHGVAGAIGA